MQVHCLLIFITNESTKMLVDARCAVDYRFLCCPIGNFRVFLMWLTWLCSNQMSSNTCVNGSQTVFFLGRRNHLLQHVILSSNTKTQHRISDGANSSQVQRNQFHYLVTGGRRVGMKLSTVCCRE